MAADLGFESYSQTLQNNSPNDVSAVRIDRAAMTDAEMHNQIILKLNNNPIVTVYNGHSSTGIWSNAAALTNSQLGFYLPRRLV